MMGATNRSDGSTLPNALPPRGKCGPAHGAAPSSPSPQARCKFAGMGADTGVAVKELIGMSFLHCYGDPLVPHADSAADPEADLNADSRIRRNIRSHFRQICPRKRAAATQAERSFNAGILRRASYASMTQRGDASSSCGLAVRGGRSLDFSYVTPRPARVGAKAGRDPTVTRHPKLAEGRRTRCTKRW
jgi:hypothetical protein